MSDLIKFHNRNYTIGAKGSTLALRNNQIGKVIFLTVPEVERLIAELDNAITALAKEANPNG